MEIVHSLNKVPIRLTNERWVHIVENHDDLAGRFYEVLDTIADPDTILEGIGGELLAVKQYKPLSLMVVYKEVSAADGFIITAFQTSRVDSLIRSRKIIWHKSQ